MGGAQKKGKATLEAVAVRVVALLRVGAGREIDEEVDVVAGVVTAHVLAEMATGPCATGMGLGHVFRTLGLAFLGF